MKSIYLVMSQTGTVLSRTIKFISGKQYNHVSISLSENLDYMYSFGRKHPYNPFIGSFVVEGIDIGIFLRFKGTTCKVIKIEVTDMQYESLCSNLYDMIKNSSKYRYNLLGLCMAAFNVHVTFDNKFYCSEFVKYILEKSGIDVSMLPSIVHPTDFMNMDNVLLYEGVLRNYSCTR